MSKRFDEYAPTRRPPPSGSCQHVGDDVTKLLKCYRFASVLVENRSGRVDQSVSRLDNEQNDLTCRAPTDCHSVSRNRGHVIGLPGQCIRLVMRPSIRTRMIIGTWCSGNEHENEVYSCSTNMAAYRIGAHLSVSIVKTVKEYVLCTLIII